MSNEPSSVDIETTRWIVGPEGAALLAQLAANCDASGSISIAYQLRLRDRYTVPQIAAAQTQLMLRGKATAKFTSAARMFFTSVGLEQASSSRIASYKAERLRSGGKFADLCCGVGGDLLELAKRGDVVGVDRNEQVAIIATANLSVCGRLNSHVEVADAAAFDVRPFDAWHIDPDRRTDGGRTTSVDAFAPAWDSIRELLAQNPNAAIKLAPATEIPPDANLHREWIGDARTCYQQVAWSGDLSPNSPSSNHRATILGETDCWTLTGKAERFPESTATLSEYIFDPSATVLAAGLLAALAEKHRLRAIAEGAVYLTGEQAIDSPGLRCYEVLHEAPLDRRSWRTFLRSQDIGTLEIKKRGVDVAPETLRKQLKLKGNSSGTLILIRRGEAVAGVLARPVRPNS